MISNAVPNELREPEIAFTNPVTISYNHDAASKTGLSLLPLAFMARLQYFGDPYPSHKETLLGVCSYTADTPSKACVRTMRC